jgi:hypothetical protein
MVFHGFPVLTSALQNRAFSRPGSHRTGLLENDILGFGRKAPQALCHSAQQGVRKASPGTRHAKCAGDHTRPCTPGNPGTAGLQGLDQHNVLAAGQVLEAIRRTIGSRADAQVGAMDVPVSRPSLFMASHALTAMFTSANRECNETAFMNHLRFFAQTRRHPSAVLLIVQLIGLLLYPFAESTRFGGHALAVFGMVVLFVTVRMVRGTPWLTWISVGLAIPTTVLLVLQAIADMPPLVIWSSALEAVFYFYAAGSLIAYMLADRKATLDELFAIGATFTLLVWAFTHLFMVVQALQPGCFLAAVNSQQARSWSELMYLSFALLSSTGIGDVIPVTVHARAVASVAMFAGVMYLAMVVSRLIGLTLQPRQ